MKYLKSYQIFEFAIIKPFEMGSLIDTLVQERPRDIESANQIAEEYGVDIVTYDQFLSSIDDQMRQGVPPRAMYMFGPQSGIHFAVMNKFTNKMNLVVSYNLFIRFLAQISPPHLKRLIKSILRHESIHLQQYGRMGNDPDIYTVHSPMEDMSKYLGHHTEVMAYAFSIVDELKSVEGKSKSEVIQIIKKGKGHRMLDDYYRIFGKGSKVIKKLNKYMYLYTDELFDIN